MPQSNVVITGSGIVSSIGIGADAFFQALVEKRSGITSLANRTDEGAKPNESSEPPGLWIGGPVIDFDPKQFVRPRKALKVMCREIQTAFAASQMSVEHADLADLLPADPEGVLKPAAIGTVFGSEMFYGPATEMEDAIRACIREDGTIDASLFGGVAMKNVIPLWMLKYLPNMPACHVGISLNAHGPNNTIVLGDVSGPAAMIEAASCIERGIADVMIAAASGTRINTTRMNYRGDLPIPEVYDPVHQSARPFDPDSKGVVGGEGAAALVLEHPDHASKRGTRPIARVVSYASRFLPSKGMKRTLRSDALNEPGLRGSAEAIQAAIETAIGDAGIQPSEIALVVSHAMGDPVIDAGERQALAAAVPGVAVTATIAAIGHTGAASGMIDLVTGVLALVHRRVPPTLQTPSTASDVGLRNQDEPLSGNHVLCLSHSSSGHAAAIVLAGA